ncbi:5818_t:CDS:2 [Funneliformis mosseae]|uniref:5818_t:CDS:1 n=1 Tax=Funneliformis mosseae TaxID=27381 RepID=A0A9N8ZKP1_FUNMO|nr:5818_t:CDS:2 [Funneliformis mosseae]
MPKDKNTPEIKRTKASLTCIQKKEICLKSLQKPKPKNKELAKEYDLEYYLKHKESASASLEALDDICKNLQSILVGYSPDDIFNTNETGLYWK